MADQPITVTLSTEQIARLKELATRCGVPIEELARAGIEDLLARPDDAFDEAAEKILRKNAELYRRLS